MNGNPSSPRLIQVFTPKDLSEKGEGERDGATSKQAEFLSPRVAGEGKTLDGKSHRRRSSILIKDDEPPVADCSGAKENRAKRDQKVGITTSQGRSGERRKRTFGWLYVFAGGKSSTAGWQRRVQGLTALEDWVSVPENRGVGPVAKC